MSGVSMEQPAQSEALSARRPPAVTDDELQHIVFDLHDGPLQQLYAAQTQVSLLQRRLTRGDRVDQADIERTLDRLGALLAAVQGELRGFLHAFRSPEFARRGLAEMLRELLTQHEAFTGCTAEFTVTGQPVTASLPVKIALFRICQEALSNADRHSGSQRRHVHLTTDDKTIVLSVRDEGRGFTPAATAGPDDALPALHIGLRSMRERAARVGGTLEIDSAPGAGVCLTVKVPCHG